MLREPCCADREQERLSGRGAQAPHRGGLSCSGAQDLEHMGLAVVAPGLWSVGSVVVVHGLS